MEQMCSQDCASVVFEALNWLETSKLATLLQGHGWVWPVLEIGHLIGLALLFGSLLFVDLSLLGFSPQLTVEAAGGLLPLTFLGFVINVVTGSMLVLGDPHHFLLNPAFWLKMGLIFLAGLNALFFAFYLRPRTRATSTVGPMPSTARFCATFSLVLWVGVVVLARFISYVEIWLPQI